METNLSRSAFLSGTKVLISWLAFTLVTFLGFAYYGGRGFKDVQITSGTILSIIFTFILILGFADYFRSKKAFFTFLCSPVLVLAPFMSFFMGLGFAPFLALIPGIILLFVLFSLVERFRGRRGVTLVFLIVSLMTLCILLPVTYSDLRALSRVNTVTGEFSETVLYPMLRKENSATLLEKLKMIDATETGCDGVSSSSLRNLCGAEAMSQKSRIKWNLGVAADSVDEEVVRVACLGHWNPQCEEKMKSIISYLNSTR